MPVVRRLFAALAVLACLSAAAAGPVGATTHRAPARAAHAKAKKKAARKKAAKKKAKPKKTTTAAKKATTTTKAKPTRTKPAATATPAAQQPVVAATPAAAPSTASTPSAPVAVAPVAAAPAAVADAAAAPAPATDALATASAVAGSLFSFAYTRDLSSWQSVQEPTGTDRITVTSAPGDAGDALRPAGNVMRVELRGGDLTTTSGYTAPRAEVFGRAATPMSQSADRWPDPPGSTRWYAFSLFVPSDFPTATDTKWLTLTQWKGLRGGSPPVAIEIKRGNLRLGGARTNAGLVPASDLGALPKGRWTRLVVGMRLSTDPSQGWVKVYRDGVLRVPQTSLATMDTVNGAPDPVYLKQGIYRDSAWTATQVLYFGTTKVGTTMDAVA